MSQLSYLHTAINAVLEAGKAILEIYDSDDFGIEIKADHSPLTKADLASHHIIQSRLEATDIPVLSEEGATIPYGVRKSWKHLWIVDPLDGTKEFIKRNGEFTVNIALIEDQKPVLGVIFAPVLGVLYFAWSASFDSHGDTTIEPGAYKVQVTDDKFDMNELMAKAVKLPLIHDTDDFSILLSRSHPSETTDAFIRDMRQKHGRVQLIARGSSLKFCLVAEGKADCYPKFGSIMEWDTAAGQVICEQAGAQVLDWTSKKSLLYNKKTLFNNWFIAQKQTGL